MHHINKREYQKYTVEEIENLRDQKIKTTHAHWLLASSFYMKTTVILPILIISIDN